MERLAERLCSSPISANTALKGGKRTGAAAGTASPAFAIRTANPNACAESFYFLELMAILVAVTGHLVDHEVHMSICK